MEAYDDAEEPPVILIVDDEAYIVDFLAMLLEEEGYLVLRAYDGEEAWRLMAESHPQLVISDVMMPRVDGLELVDRLRGAAELHGVRVVLMSAVTRVRGPQGVRFLRKPFDIDQMLAVVTDELAASADCDMARRGAGGI